MLQVKTTTSEFIKDKDKQDLYEELYEFNDKSENQKLSIDQRKWIKNKLNTSKLTIERSSIQISHFIFKVKYNKEMLLESIQFT